MMLLQMLPGIREARAPLAAGYITLLAAWLYAQDQLADSSTATDDGYAAFERLQHILGPAGLAVAVSFAAYLVGAALVQAVPTVLRRGDEATEWAYSAVKEIRGDRLFLRDESTSLADLTSRIRGLVADQLRDTKAGLYAALNALERGPLGGERLLDAANWSDDMSEDAFQRKVEKAVVANIVTEIANGVADDRLLANKPELFGEVTRAKAEANLRLGITLPLIALLPAILINVPWAVLVEIPSALGYVGFLWVLVVQANAQWHRSVLITMRAVADEVVTTPMMDAINRAIVDDRATPG